LILNESMLNIWNRRLTNSGRFHLLLFALYFLTIPSSHAFKLVPILMEFEPAGRGANRAFRLENDSNSTVAIEVSMLTREVNLDGVESNEPAEDEFLVYPPQVLLGPKQTQTVRVRWLGDPNPEKELAYRIVAEQLPVNLESEQRSGARINVLIRYIGSVYIAPKGAKADVVLESAVSKTNAAGEAGIELIFHNRGTARAMLQELRLTIQAGDNRIELEGDALPQVTGPNLLAGERRRYALPWPEGLPNEGPLRVTFDFRQPFKR
jgi:fimbrial chaperone protein